MSKKDYYEVLGVSKTATSIEIKGAFRQKAKTCHPDYYPGDEEAETLFKEINEAYEILKDDQKRSAYDQFGHAAFAGGRSNAGGFGGFSEGFDFSGSGFESIFEEMFSGFSGRTKGNAGGVRKGDDVRVDLTITLEEAYAGVKKNVSVETFVKCDSCAGKGGKTIETCPTCGGHGRIRQRQGFFVVETECPVCHGSGKSIKDPCSACKGMGRVKKKRSLEVNIPKGVDTGIRMRLAGEGNAGVYGGGNGDLYVFLTVKEHSIFTRQGDDLYCELPIPMHMAVLGWKITAPTIDGKGEEIELKAGLQTGDKMKLKGKGMPVLRGSGFGDLYMIFKIETPRNLNARQKELMKEFAGVWQEHHEECKNFVCKLKKFLGK